MFLAEIPVVRGGFHRLGGDGDLPGLAREAHRLKGAAGTMGARFLADLACALEASCGAGNQALAELQLEAIDSELGLLEAEIGAILSAGRSLPT